MGRVYFGVHDSVRLAFITEDATFAKKSYLVVLADALEAFKDRQLNARFHRAAVDIIYLVGPPGVVSLKTRLRGNVPEVTGNFYPKKDMSLETILASSQNLVALVLATEDTADNCNSILTKLGYEVVKLEPRQKEQEF